ncbi:aspartate kinase [Rapidithrix thailandica]|uniref:Aspartokinase n=1 Tax=Rapidithrix thailandica TaxID=413964 RepID=A0AAW9S4I1_9BACT
MKVLKFGGTSVGNAERIQYVASLINNEEPKVVVLSAVSGTTNALVEIAGLYFKGKKETAREKVDELADTYETLTGQLYQESSALKNAQAFLTEKFTFLKQFAEGEFGEKQEKEILAQGEVISTNLMKFYLDEKGVEAELLSAFDFMRTKEGEPDLEYLGKQLSAILKPKQEEGKKLFITQGYICLNESGEVDNLQRGGSDYTASLIGAGILAEEIQIWTDIDGMHNNDPRIVKDTFPVRELSFDEAAELAYFGAKILHPASILPAQKRSIPVRLKSTMKPDADGTLITDQTTPKKIKAIAAKDGIYAIKIKSSRMLLAYGFLRKVFEVFEKYKTPIDMITTSEVAVSLTIDNPKHLAAIEAELAEFGSVQIDEGLTIVCAVGQYLQDEPGLVAKVLDCLKHIPIRMVSYGGSKNNVSLLVHNSDKENALLTLNKGLF